MKLQCMVLPEVMLPYFNDVFNLTASFKRTGFLLIILSVLKTEKN